MTPRQVLILYPLLLALPELSLDLHEALELALDDTGVFPLLLLFFPAKILDLGTICGLKENSSLVTCLIASFDNRS